MFKVSIIAIFAVLSGAAMASTVVSPANVSTDTQIVARKGADDRPGDKRHGNDGAGHASLGSGDVLIQMARKGADDRPGDKRHGNDGPGHA
jgi:hypothetical protein